MTWKLSQERDKLKQRQEDGKRKKLEVKSSRIKPMSVPATSSDR